jgi:hypothetical protein
MLLSPRTDMAPFNRYPHGGRVLLGPVNTADGNCRRGYGPAVFTRCGGKCVYCETDVHGTYEAWLQISVDHVVPDFTVRRGWPTEWVRDAINLVTCCRTCNEFSNDFYSKNWPEPLPVCPVTLEQFCDIRDRFFDEKRALTLKRRAAERAWYTRWHAAFRPDSEAPVDSSEADGGT